MLHLLWPALLTPSGAEPGPPPDPGLHLAELHLTDQTALGRPTAMKIWAVCDEDEHPVRPARFAWEVGDGDTYAHIEAGRRRARWIGRVGLGTAALGFAGMGLALSAEEPRVELAAPLFLLGGAGLSTALVTPVLGHNAERWYPRFYTPDRAAELLASPRDRDPLALAQLPAELRPRDLRQPLLVRCHPGSDLHNYPTPVRP